MVPLRPLVVAVLVIIAGHLHAQNPSLPQPGKTVDGTVNAESPLLTASRAQYEVKLKELQSKIADANQKRTTKYVGDLQVLEKQIAASGNLDALLPVKAEREAYQAGKTTVGFGSKETTVPQAARQLRVTYEGDLDKITKFATTEEQNIGLGYVRELEGLERQLTTAQQIDAAIAVRVEKKEMESLLNEPSAPVATAGASKPAAAPSTATALNVSSTANPTAEAARISEAFASLTREAQKAPREHYIAAMKSLVDKFTRESNHAAAEAAGAELKVIEGAHGDLLEVGSGFDSRSNPDLGSARKKFLQECGTAIKPFLERYTASLQTLSSVASHQGDRAEVTELQKRISAENNAEQLVGVWRWTWGKDGVAFKILHRDGRVTEPDPSGKPLGSWEIQDKSLVFHYANHTETFPLPLHVFGMNGRGSGKTAYQITKE